MIYRSHDLWHKGLLERIDSIDSVGGGQQSSFEKNLVVLLEVDAISRGELPSPSADPTRAQTGPFPRHGNIYDDFQSIVHIHASMNPVDLSDAISVAINEALDARLGTLQQDVEDLQTMITNSQSGNILSPTVDFYDSAPKRARRDGGDVGSALPRNVMQTSLEEAQAFYHDCFIPPELEPGSLNETKGKDLNPDKHASGEIIRQFYQKMNSNAVVEQRSNMDAFMEAIAGILGPHASKVELRKPMVFYYQVRSLCPLLCPLLYTLLCPLLCRCFVRCFVRCSAGALSVA